jgi:aerobic carbon-monoxide dehydrogenase small subunit
MELRDVTLTINGREYRARVEARKTLADTIREDCGLTGTHLGCEHGVCGACTILMDGEAVRSCLLFAVQAQGADLRTVEGLAQSKDGEEARLHPIQQAFWEHHGLQCGFCTPGFLMTAVAFLRDNPHPTEREIREGLAGNLCRCTGYQNIVKAVAAAADMLTSTPRRPEERTRRTAGKQGAREPRRTRERPTRRRRVPRASPAKAARRSEKTRRRRRTTRQHK